MKTVLIISSFVSASHVGAGNSAFCLHRLGLETSVLPTTLFGRHPGWGAPGGTITSIELLRGIWDGVYAQIKKQGLKIDAVLTGYMGSTDHVDLACEIIQTLRTHAPNLEVLIDPVMGDHGRLYVKEAVAQKLVQSLLPLANIITPNLWEFEFITKKKPKDITALCKIAQTDLPCEAVITSVPTVDAQEKELIGTLLIKKNECAYVGHPKFKSVPNGGGDAFAGTYFGHRLSGLPAAQALRQATASIFKIIKAANTEDLGELPLVRRQDALLNPPTLPIQSLSCDPSYDL